MDDDRILFLIILIAMFCVIFGFVHVIQLSLQPTKRIATIMVLQSPDLEQKKIIVMPTVIAGRLRADDIVPWQCYVYNPKEYNQTVSIVWWLGFQVEEEKKYVEFYSSLGANFTITPWERLDCDLSFSLKPDTPKLALKKLEETTIWVDFTSEVIQ